MAKKSIGKREKPKEILELEKDFGVVLEEVNKDFDYNGRLFNRSYALNENGEVNSVSLCDNSIKDVSRFNVFSELEYLALSRNDIVEIGNLSPKLNLKYLYLGGNKIKNIDILNQYKELISLAIWGNPIEDFSVINYLTQLQAISFAGTKVVDLSFVLNLTNLVDINSTDNLISELPDLTNLSQLKYLSLENNKLEDISNLENLNSKVEFNLSGNNIKFLSKKNAERLELLTKHKIYLSNGIINNPLEFPPTSVIELGPETVQNYYEAAEQFGHAPLSEGRVIVIGDGEAGKSSLIEKMLYGTFEKGRAQTNGIKIEHFHLPHPDGNRDLVFHIWDFGGQEIQHAVHKFFFSEGCVYVLVLNNRREEEPDYWLQQIESLGGKAPVLVVFNKYDENQTEIADRKYLKEKYPNIIGFINTSCLNGFGIDDFRNSLEKEVVKLRTVREQFPKNWLAIKKSIEAITTGTQHYLTYETYQAICEQNNTPTESTQRLLLRYFNTIGAVTWFGEDTHLKFLHVLKPEWITQGVYKILTGKVTTKLFGQIKISDFKELLYPSQEGDYTYDEKHYGYILSMMKKFDLCDAPDDKHLLIPSAFGKVPKVEYSDFRGEAVSTYILQFKDYMPLALIHRFTAKNIKQALDSNYWYTGIVIKDSMNTGTLAMVHADKEAKRIYVRIKGTDKLGMWGHIRRELAGITSSYAKIPYDELVVLDDTTENTVKYEDLISHLQANKPTYFHAGLKRDYNVGYLMGLFESKEATIEKITKTDNKFEGIHAYLSEGYHTPFIQILNNNSQQVTTQVNNQINIDININIINNLSGEILGEANYLLGELGKENKELTEALEKLVQFAEDAKQAKTSSDVKAKGWGRKLKNVLEVVSTGGKQLKDLKDGGEALKTMLHGVKELASHVHLHDIADFVNNLHLFS